MPSQHSHGPRFIDSIRAAGIRPDDSDEVKLAKSSRSSPQAGSITSILWLLLYWTLGPKLSSSFPFAFQLLLAGNLLLYIRRAAASTVSCYTQLGLFLFAPFAVQWSMGNIITASGIVLWGLLAPIGARRLRCTPVPRLVHRLAAAGWGFWVLRLLPRGFRGPSVVLRRRRLFSLP